MEKKNVQRIVGVLVIVALVIIVMPLLFSKNDFPAPQAENTKESMTPAQTTDIAANTDSADTAIGQGSTITDSSNGNPVEITPNSPQNITDTTNAGNQTNPDMTPGDANTTPSDQKPTASATNSSITSLPNATSTTNNVQSATLPVPDALNPSINAAAVTASANTTATATPAADVAKVETAAPNKTNADSNADKKASTTATKPTHSKKQAHTAIKAKSIKAKVAKANVSKKHLAKNAKTPAWVIQMGSFNNKNNAIRLTAKLRAAGFKVFTHEFKSASGKVSTRVYVGPELKQASATKLSTVVHQKMNMQGMVMLYKPVV